jgi:aminomethyltransferase
MLFSHFKMSATMNRLAFLARLGKTSFGVSIRLASSDSLLRTCLYDLHVSHGAKMGDFTGYAMPMQYDGEGIVDSHKHVR